MNVGDTQIIIGKRVTIGALINSIAGTLAVIYPNHAMALLASTIGVTFVVQVAIAHWGGVTVRDEK